MPISTIFADYYEMSSAIVLINSEIGKESKVLDELCEMAEVEHAYLVYGVYDIVAKINSASMDGLESLLMNKIRSLPGVKRTLTLIISRSRGSSE